MAFQTHDLCGFHRKRFIRKFWRCLLILKLLDFSHRLASLTLRINRTSAIYGIDLIIIRMREGYEGGVCLDAWGQDRDHL